MLNRAMFLPKRTILALSVMIDIAQNASQSPVSSKDLADRHGVSPRFFEIMLKNLASSALIRGQRGPKGGYRLERDPQNIRVGDIVSSVSAEPEEQEFSLPQSAEGQLMPYIDTINAAILQKLNETTLANLMGMKKAQNWPASALAS
ncbi:MAG: Rrf2 family transcriptional regulator [Pseudomonadota bacterium]